MASPSRSLAGTASRIAQGPQATRRRGCCHTHKTLHTSQPLANTSATKTHMALIGGDSIPVRDGPPEGLAPQYEDQLVAHDHAARREAAVEIRRVPSARPPPARARSAYPSRGTSSSRW